MGQALAWLLENLQENSSNVVAFKSPDVDRTGADLHEGRQAARLIAAVEDIARWAETRTQFLLNDELQMTQQFNAWVAVANEAFEQAQSHLARVDTQLDDAQRRAETAEQRAVELERRLSRIEKALQNTFFMDFQAPTTHRFQ